MKVVRMESLLGKSEMKMGKESARGQGIGLALAAKATQLHKEAGLEIATADYTYLVEWYGRLGYSVWRKYHMIKKPL